jgi:hypothetical protein
MFIAIIIKIWFGFFNLPTFEVNTPTAYYLGMESMVQIRLNGCDAGDINIKINPGNIYKRNDSTYAFIPQYETEDLKIKLYYKKVICEVKTVTVKKLPELIPVFDGEKQGFVKANELDKLGILHNVYPADFPEDMKSQVYSFNLFVIHPNGATIYSGSVRGDRVDENTFTLIKKLPVGGKIIINNILMQNTTRGMSRSTVNKELTVID